MQFLKRKIGQQQIFLQIVGKGGLGGPCGPCDLGGPGGLGCTGGRMVRVV